MRRIFALLMLLLASTALAESREDRAFALVKRLPAQEQEFLTKAKYAGHYSLWRLVTYTTQDGRLVANFHLPEELSRQFTDPAPLIVSVEGSPHLWTVSRSKSGTLDQGLSMITLTCYAPDEVRPFNRFSLSSDGHRIMVWGAQMAGHPMVQQTLSLTEADRSIVIRWHLAFNGYANKDVKITELAQLPSRAPNILERYLMPILRRLGPARAASDVYRVFDQIPADPKITQKVIPLLNKLDSDDTATRDAATAALKAMGPPAMLACMRLDASTLTPEQKNRVDAFCASDGWIHISDVEAARNDAEFLASCVEDEDPAVRTVAENLLAALRTAREFKQ